MHHIKIALFHPGNQIIFFKVGIQLIRIASQKQGMKEHAIACDLVVENGSLLVLFVSRAGRIMFPDIHHNTYLRMGKGIGTEKFHRLSMAEQEIVQRLAGIFFILQTRGKKAISSSHINRNRLVESRPEIHIITEVIQQNLRIICKPLHALTVAKAALNLQSIGKIPVVHRRIRHNSVCLQGSDQLLIVLDSCRIDFSCSIRNDTGPGKRKTVGFKPYFLHHLNIFLVEMIRIAGNIRHIIVLDSAGKMSKCIPDRRASAVFIGSTFNLCSRRRCAPEKCFWKFVFHRLVFLLH